MKGLHGIPFLALLLCLPALAQTTPEPLHPALMVAPVIQAAGTPVRLAHDASTGDLYYLTINGDVYKLAPPYDEQELAFTATDHGLTGQTLGLAIATDGTIYLVDNQVDGALTTGIIVRGERGSDGSVAWSTVAQTEPYPRSNTPFDHNVNGLAISPDGAFLYLNSGSRTDHGEVQDNDGQFPGLREAPITSAILRIPADGDDLLIPNDTDALHDGGYLFADGTRNSFDLAFAPNGDLFGTENAGDRDDPEELNWLREGHHYGFPWRIGGNDTPMQFDGYDPDQDLLLNPASFAVQNGFFYNDPPFPPRPESLVFTDAVRNLGPDARHYRDPADGSIQEADGIMSFTTFTTHRSPLGLVFDVDGTLPEPFMGDGFVLGWTGADDSALLAPFGETGEDLLHLELHKNSDGYEANVTQVMRGFTNPIDAVLVDNTLYVLEYGGDRMLWAITFAMDLAVEDETPASFVAMDVFPNPSSSSIQVEIKLATTQDARIEVFNVLGQRIALVREGVFVAGQPHRFSVETASWPAGVYLIRIVGEHNTQAQTLVVTK